MTRKTSACEYAPGRSRPEHQQSICRSFADPFIHSHINLGEGSDRILLTEGSLRAATTFEPVNADCSALAPHAADLLPFEPSPALFAGEGMGEGPFKIPLATPTSTTDAALVHQMPGMKASVSSI